MGEQKVTITATPSKVKQINVTSSLVANQITATPDTSLYYSNLSKQWATKMDGKVVNEDYSSKYYANVSAENSQISQINAQACEDARVLLQGEYNEYSENLLETKKIAVDEINTLTDNSISELQTELSGLSTSASTIVSTSKTDIQNTATSAKNTAISAIQSQQTTSVNAVKTEGTTQVNLAKAQATAAANSATQASNVVKEVEEDLASKVDIDDMVQVDFANAGSYIANCAMPSNKYISLTLGASGSTYTAPANGWFVFGKSATATGQYMRLSSSSGVKIEIGAVFNTQGLFCYIPVRKGDVMTPTYNLGGVTGEFKFFYAEGEVAE